MTYVTYVGFLAAICTTGSLVPQLMKIIKTKHVKDLSLEMYLVFLLGVSCWLIYGILQKDLVIIAANSVSIILGIWILTLKLIYDEKH